MEEFALFLRLGYGTRGTVLPVASEKRRSVYSELSAIEIQVCMLMKQNGQHACQVTQGILNFSVVHMLTRTNNKTEPVRLGVLDHVREGIKESR